MTIFLCISLVATALLVLDARFRAALLLFGCTIAAGFGYRLYSGDELRIVTTDALFVAATLPIAWWFTGSLFRITDSADSAAGHPENN